MVSTDQATLAKVRRAIEEHGVEGAHVLLRDSLLRNGATRETAEEVSARDIARAQTLSASPADLADGMSGAPQAAVGDDMPMRDPYPGAGRPGYDRTFTPQELEAQRDAPKPAQGYQRVPAPRIPYGGPVPEPGVITNPEEIEAYTTREWDGQRNAYKPSQKDRDMSARGLVPVLNEDGSVGYSVGYPNGSIAGDNANRFPGAPGRSGERRDLKAKGWEEVTVDSPLGQQTVYRPGKEAQARYDAQAEQRSRRRIAERAGLSDAEAQSLTMDKLRSRARAARIDDANARREAWKAQTMLAGGQPTGGPRGTKAATTALQMLPPEWQSLILAKGLRPDLDGTTPLTVEANSAKNAMRLLNADIIGQGLMGDTRAQMAADARRQQAFEFARAEADKIVGGMFGSGQLSEEDARRIRRRVEARFPGMGGVVDALPIAEGGKATAGGADSLPAVPAPPTTPVGTGGIPYYPRTGM